MAESQSRFSIMEELTNRKLGAKATLDDLEKSYADYLVKVDKNIQEIESDITTEKATYKQNHDQWKYNKQFQLAQKKRQYKELIEELIKLELTNNEIMSCVNLAHPGYIWKIKHYLKQEFTNIYGNQNLPKYLEDGRKK